MIENSDIVYGRLLESAHISGYTFERVCSELEWLLDADRWRQVGGGHTDINAFLATVDLSPFNITAERRKVLVRRLDELKATQRATAKAIGASKSAVNRDLALVPDGTDGQDDAAPDQQERATPVPDGTGSPADPPAWFARDPADVARDAATGTRQAAARARTPAPVGEPIPPRDGRYRCIVIDPPWPMKKIERAERPNQGVTLDYPVLSLEQIADEHHVPVRTHAADDCHIYLWVTHKFLPAGLELLTAWGFNYQCAMTWRKNVGITPFSWMYDTEHVLFGRRGDLPLEQLGLRLSFEAPAVGHSVKPDVFYDRVLAASPGPRVEMFARRERDGFDAWGNEVTADVV